jgi:transposase
MGRKTLEVQGYSPEEIRALFSKDERYTIGIRLYAVYQVSLGQASRKLESLYNTSFKQITNWVHRFEESGVEGLKDKPKSGRIPKLTSENLIELSNVLKNNRPEEYGYNTATWNGPILREFIEKHYGVKYQKAQTYNLLKKLGFTYQKGKAKYPEADEEKRKEFKETIKKTSRRTK